MEINRDCDTIYNGVYLNSYLMLFVNAVGFKVMQLVVESVASQLFDGKKNTKDTPSVVFSKGEIELVRVVVRGVDPSVHCNIDSDGCGADTVPVGISPTDHDEFIRDTLPGDLQAPSFLALETESNCVDEQDDTDDSGSDTPNSTGSSTPTPSTEADHAVNKQHDIEGGAVDDYAAIGATDEDSVAASMQSQEDPFPWQLGLTPQVVFYILQSAFALAAIGIGLASIDASRNRWDQYQDFYGYLTNSVAGTFFISCCSKIAPRLRQSNRSLRVLLRSKEGPSFLVVCILGPLFLPVLSTHVIEGLVAYCWVVAAIALTLLSVSQVLLYLRNIIKQNGLLLLSKEREDVAFKIFVEISLLFLFTWCLQTSVNYMAFVYRHDHFIGENAYWKVVALEYDLRTQTYCLFQNYANNGRNFMLFWGWL